MFLTVQVVLLEEWKKLKPTQPTDEHAAVPYMKNSVKETIQ
jgi:hypothetical protein